MSSLHEEAQKHRRAFASLAAGAEAGGDCPRPGQLWDAAVGRAPAEERRALVRHLAGCPGCAEDWRLASEIGRQEGGEAAALDGGRRRSHARWALIAAALVVALIAVPVWVGDDGQEMPSTFRAGAGAVELLSLLPENAVLQRSRCILRWSAGGEAVERFDLVVASERLDVLVEARGLEESEYRVPAEALAGLPPGSSLLWRVEASLADGRRVASPTFSHRLR